MGPRGVVQETGTAVTHLPPGGEPHCPAILMCCCRSLCFRTLPLQLPSSSECWHSMSVHCQKTALVLVFSHHNVSRTLQWKKKKDIQIIRLFYKSLSLLFSSDSYGFYTTTCMPVSCWFFLPSSLSLKKNPKNPQCQKPSLPSPGRVPSLILARYVYTDYALQ